MQIEALVEHIDALRAENDRLKSAAKRAMLIARNGRYPAVHLVEACRAFDELEELTHNS